MKLSACYIVKNEAANLRRSVASIAGAYDELVVVDTGSTDDTVAMVRQLGACVLQVPWQDDFAAARNAALDAATGDYILFLDADEYVSADTAPQLRVLLARELAQADALLLHMLHIDGAEANVIGDTYVLRAMRHLPRLRYVGRIHEELRDNGAPLQHLAVVPDAQLRLYHTGYAAAVNHAKAARNLRLLQHELAMAEQRGDEAEQGRLYMYLAEACRGVGDMARAEEFARRDIRQGRRPVVDASRSYHLLLHLLAQDPARQAEREQVAEAAVRDFPELPELHAELAVLCAAHLDLPHALREMQAALACSPEQLGLEPDRFPAEARAQAEQLLARWQDIQRAAAGLSVTACLITRGSAELTDWLRGAAIYADKIIVVDTGAPQGSIQRAAQAAGADSAALSIVPFAWCDDFAAARNAALAQVADGSWVGFPDDDETFTCPAAVRPAIVLAQRQQPPAVGVQASIINVDADAADLEISRFPALRIWQAAPARRYQGRIHEALLDAGRPLAPQYTEPCLTVRHTGYSSDRVQAKLERNLQLLYRQLQEGTATPLTARYLADCLYGLGEYALALHYAQAALDQHVATADGDLPLYSLGLHCLQKLQQPIAVQQQWAERAQAALPGQPEPLAWRGLLALQQGRQEGEQLLTAFLAQATACRDAHLLGRVQAAMGQLLLATDAAAARQHLRQALQLDPYAPAALRACWQVTQGAEDFLALVLPHYGQRRQRGLHFLAVWAEREGLEELYAAVQDALRGLGVPVDSLASLHELAAQPAAWRDALFGRAGQYVQLLFTALVELTAGQAERAVPETRRADWQALLPAGMQRLLVRLAGGEPLPPEARADYETGRNVIRGLVSEAAQARYEAMAADFAAEGEEEQHG